MLNTKQDYPIKNTQVYKFSDGTYHVSFDANNLHYTFTGSRAVVLPLLTLRVKRILHVR